MALAVRRVDVIRPHDAVQVNLVRLMHAVDADEFGSAFGCRRLADTDLGYRRLSFVRLTRCSRQPALRRTLCRWPTEVELSRRNRSSPKTSR